MERRRVDWYYRLDNTLATVSHPGLLLAATRRDGASNVMTIGWVTVGTIWSKPIMTVLVRPSRYTYGFIEETDCFSVNVPTREMQEWVAVCGSKSGRDIDKFKAYGMRTEPGRHGVAATVSGCSMAYECRVVHKNDVIPAHLDPEIESQAYRGRDYHRVYFGEILGAYAADGW